MFGVVVADHFVVEEGKDHVGTSSLGKGAVAAVAADGVVAVDHAFTVFVQTGDQVEGVVGEESAAVERLGEEVSDGLGGGQSFDFVVVDLELGLEHLRGSGGTFVSSQKSAYMPEVARMVLSVSCTSLVSLLVTMLYPSESLESPPTTTKSSPAMATTVPPLLT